MQKELGKPSRPGRRAFRSPATLEACLMPGIVAETLDALLAQPTDLPARHRKNSQVDKEDDIHWPRRLIKVGKRFTFLAVT
jgi:hypothetical protein